MKILLVASEVAPFAKTGGLADVAGALPRALTRLGHEVHVVLPCYPEVVRRGFTPRDSGLNFTIELGPRCCRTRVLKLDRDGITTWFIEQPELFDRPGLYGYSSGDYPDNIERFGFFCRAVLALLKQGGFRPDILHLNDWQTGLIPLLLKTDHAEEPFFRDLATLFTIHNLGYQGLFPAYNLYRAGIRPDPAHRQQITHHGQISLLKSGILFADRINTVSPNYAREICTPEYGAGLEDLLKTRRERLSGILNGIDPDDWNPRRDTELPANYDPDNLSGKARCKQLLQQELGLQEDENRLLVALVTRLVPQKGLDLLAEIWNKLQQRPIQLVLLGTGDEDIRRQLESLRRDHRQVALRFSFDEPLARRIYAGADLFMMPSRYEPCGLGQLIALRYGAVPLVRATGGLADTVIDIDDDPQHGTGFSFNAPEADALLQAIDRALDRFAEKDDWKKLIRRGMRRDFSWRRSAAAYLDLYRRLRECADD